MKVKCKSCFKIYDDKQGACPECGKINEPLNKKKACLFCGHRISLFKEACDVCGNGKIDRVSVQNKERMLVDVVDDAYGLSGTLNTKYLDDTMLDIDNWSMSYNYKFGEKANKQMIQIFGYVLLGLFILAIGDSKIKDIMIGVLVIGVPVGLLIHLLSDRFYMSYVNIYQDNIKETVMFHHRLSNENGHYKGSKFFAYIDDLSSIELIHNEALESIRFVAKQESDVNTYKLRVKGFEDVKALKTVLFLLSKKHDLPIIIIHQSGNIETDSIFARYDRTIIEPDIETIHAHQEFMEMFKTKYSVKYVDLEGRSVMVIQTERPDQMKIDMYKDPLITKGYVEIELTLIK